MAQSILFAVFGVLFLVVGLFYKTTAEYSDTLNIGLLQNQLILVQIGLTLWIVAALSQFRRSAQSEPLTFDAKNFATRPNIILGGGLVIFLLVVLLSM